MATGMGSVPALCSTRIQPYGVSRSIDQEPFDSPPIAVNFSSGMPMSAAMPSRAAPPCVASTARPSSGSLAAMSPTASAIRCATSRRVSPPPTRSSGSPARHAA